MYMKPMRDGTCEFCGKNPDTYKPDCLRCNDAGCPACDKENRRSKHNPEPY